MIQNERTKLKICGITNLDDARFCSGHLVDFLGFIFVTSSPRYIHPDKASAIISWLEGPQSVGVFQNLPADQVNDIALFSGVKMVQLHGDESPEYCALMEKPIIKTISVETGDTANEISQRMKPYQNVVEYFLLDTKLGNKSGGTGQTFDWNVLAEIESEVPFFVAGGISPENVLDLVSLHQPWGIDVSSSLESEPGLKDFDKIEAFLAAFEEAHV